MTYQISAEYAQQNFEQVMQQAEQESEGVVITHGEKKFILIEQSKLQDLQEAEQLEQLPSLFKNIAPLRTEYAHELPHPKEGWGFQLHGE